MTLNCGLRAPHCISQAVFTIALQDNEKTQTKKNHGRNYLVDVSNEEGQELLSIVGKELLQLLFCLLNCTLKLIP